METGLLVLCATLALAAAGPVRLMEDFSDSCASSCQAYGPSKFQYRPGQTYTYDYSLQTETSMDGASEEKAVLSITGQADIQVIDQCDFVLLLKNIRIDESSPARDGQLAPSPKGAELRRVLESAPLRFAFQDGVVAELCPDRDEDPWALNVKRGLLSALQNSMDSLEGQQTVDETDVTGKCQTQYEVSKGDYWGSSKSIKRSKNLMACTDRHGYSGSLQTAPYQMASEMQSVPLMTSEHECQQEVARGLIHKSTCSEKHVFRPFSSQQGGALTAVSQSLNYKSQRPGITERKARIHSRAEMTFDHGYSVKNSREARESSLQILNQLCQMSMQGATPEVPRTFSQLVGAVAKLDNGDLRDIYQQLQRGQICSMNNDRTKKFFLDALPMAGSSPTVDLMKDLMISGDVTGPEVDLWLASLAFIAQPSAEMIESVQALLQVDSLKMRAMLAVSSMVNNRCQRTDCSGRAVDSIMQALEDVIGYRCSVNDGNIKTVLTALSAIGNTGQSRAINILNRCLGNRSPVEVRVAAAKAFRRMPCDADKRQLTQLLQDASEDSEIRIAAYLQIMTCPTPSVLTQIQIVVESEPEDSQVGSFIWSHLSNLKETSSPLKQSIKDVIKDIELKKLFDLNPLKFSRNYEKSAFLQMINSGLVGESNVVWSATSPLPRSMSANITFDLFGHSVNLLELGGRLEGIEYLVETVQSQLFGDGKDKSASRKLDELKGSGFARIFGNELAYSRFQGIQSLFSGKTFNLLDFLIKLSKDHDYSFTQSLQFLDSSITVPTACGLPLTLSVNGTAVVDVKATGKMDLTKVSTSPRSIYIDGEIRPSGSVNVDGVMSVDALVTRSGLKVSSSLHSSLAVKGRVDLDRGRVLNLQVDMPDDKMDILDVRTKFFILHNTDAESEQKMITANRKEFQMCSGDKMSQVIGLEVCGQLQFPNASMESAGPYFPLTGPSSLSIVLHKRDSHTGYKVLAKRVQNQRSSIAQLSFDTPGSSVMRAVSFDMMLNFAQKDAELSFASPWKKASVKGSLLNDAGMKSLTGSLVVDDDQTYSVTSEMKVDQQAGGKVKVFLPMLEIRRPGADKISLMGNVQMDARGRSLNSDLSINGASKETIKAVAAYVNDDKQKEVRASLSYGKKKWSAQAGADYKLRNGRNVQLQLTPTFLVSSPEGDLVKLEGATDFRQGKLMRGELTLTAPKYMRKPANLKVDMSARDKKKGSNYQIKLIRLKSQPFTAKVTGFVNIGDTVATKLSVNYNLNRVGRDTITVSGKLSNKTRSAFMKYTLRSSVGFQRHPEWNVLTSVNFDHDMHAGQKKKHTALAIKSTLGKDAKSKDNKVAVSASLNRDVRDMTDLDLDYDLSADIPMLDVSTKISGQHSHSPASLASRLNTKLGKNGFMDAAINLKQKAGSKLRLNGDASLAFLDHSYEVDSSVKQDGKKFVHALNTKTHNGPFLTTTSTYRGSKGNTHDVTSDIRLDGAKPIKMSGSAGLELDDLHLDGQVLHGQDSYALNAASKMSRGPRGRWSLELRHPARNLGLTASGGLQKGKAALDLDMAWDKERDDSAKITVVANSGHKTTGAVTTSNANLEISTPFQPLPSLKASVSYNDDAKRYGLDSKVTVGGKANQFYSTLEVRKPYSPSNVHVTWQANTPLKGYKRMQIDVDHDHSQRSLNSIVKATRGKDVSSIAIKGSDNGDRNNRDLSGDVSIKSGIRHFEDVSMSVNHKDDGRKFQTGGSFIRNKDKYSADLDLTHYRRDWQIQNNGKLVLTTPEQDISTNWKHRSSDDDLTSTLTSNWGRGKDLKVDISGSKALSYLNNKVNGAVSVQTPWRQVRDLSLTLDHEHDDQKCQHSTQLVHNGQKVGSTALNYQVTPGDVSGDISVSTPFNDNTSGKLRVQHGLYPVTGHAEVQVKPGQTLTGDLSFNKQRSLDMDGNVRITTPFRDLRALTLTGSSKQEGRDVVAKAALDYGVRKAYDAELRVRPDDLSLARVKINTPLTKFSSLETGYEMSGDSNDLSAIADLTVLPALGKYSGSLTWQLDDDLTAKLRVDTPLQDLRYVQLMASSARAQQGRKSRLEAEYFPRQLYALSSFYSTEMPLIVTLEAETPIAGYDSFGLSLRHQHEASSVNTHGELQYLPDRVIKSTLILDWEDNVHGSLLVNTPFAGFEESRVSMRHDGDLNDFTSHAEGELMQQTMAADARFKSGAKSFGTFTLTSSLDDLQTIEAKFNKMGSLKKFKGSASASYGDDTVEGDVQHRFNDRGLKSSASFKSPFTRNMEASVDYDNRHGKMETEVMGRYGPNKVESKTSLQIAQARDIIASSELNFRLNGRQQGIKVSASKQGEWDNVDMAAAFTSPFTADSAVSVKHSGRPSSFVTSVKANYGSDYTISSDNSLDNRGQAFSAATSTKYTMEGPEQEISASVGKNGDLDDISVSANAKYNDQEMKMSASKKGEWDNVDMAASLTSPFTEDSAVSVKHSGRPSSFRTSVKANYGSDYTISSDNSLDNRGKAISASTATKYTMEGPEQEISASVSKNGDLDDISVSANAKYNDQEMKVNGELNRRDGVVGKIEAQTPFPGFERVSADLSHSPDDNGFRQQASVTYRTGATIQHTLNLQQDGLRSVKLDTSLTSPILNLESTSASVDFAYDEDRKTCSGSALINSVLGRHVVSYRREGDWDNMTLKASLDGNGEKMEGTLTKVPLRNGAKHAIDLKMLGEELQASVEMEKSAEKISGKAMASVAPSFISIEGDASLVDLLAELNGKLDINVESNINTATISAKKSGHSSDMTLDLQGALNAHKAAATAEYKKTAGDVSGSLKIKTPFQGFSDIGSSFKHSASPGRFNSDCSLTYADDQQISAKANFYRYAWSRLEVSGEVHTPFSGLEVTKAEYRHAGSPGSLTCSSSLQYGANKKLSADLRADLDPKYDVTLTVKTPFRSYRKLVASGQLDSVGNAHSASAALDLGSARRFALDASLDTDSLPMTATGKLATPLAFLKDIQISATHRGSMDDFVTSFVFNSPETDAIKGEAQLQVNSISDFSGHASLGSQIAGLQDLRAEVKAGETGTVHNAHTMVRWAPRRELTLDGSYDLGDYRYQKQLTAEASVSTPFQALPSASVHVEYEKQDSTHTNKVSMTVNGKVLVDADGQLTLGADPSMSLTSRQPWPAQVTGSLTAGEQTEGEVFVNWNRDEVDQFVRLQTKVKDNSDDSKKDMDYSVKMILPARTVSSGVTLNQDDRQMTSDGFLSWDDRADRKIFYSVKLNDNSRYYSTMYEANVKVGVPARTVEGSGSFTSRRQTYDVDAALAWDADRDDSQKVGFNAKLTSGDKVKADLTLRLPAINKEVHIEHEMEMNQGRTVWDGKTELSYSRDSRKTLTLASSLKDVSDSFSSGQNYSLVVAISHPHTETDISLTSHIGSNGDRLSAAMDTVYLTSRRERKNMALRGEIDRLRRQIDLQLVSPIKKVAIHGEVMSTEPLDIKMTNTYDDQAAIESRLNIDPARRSIQFITNYDLDNPDAQLIAEARYVNSSAIQAEVYRQQRSRKISDSLLAVRLNTSTLLHTRLAWRPRTMADIQSYGRDKTMSYADGIREVLEIVSSATGQELSDKYAAIAEEIYTELSPVVDLVSAELNRLSNQVEKARRRTSRMIRNNDFYLGALAATANEILESVKLYNDIYSQRYTEIIASINAQLEGLKDYDIQQAYDSLVNELSEKVEVELARGAALISEMLAELDSQLQTLAESADAGWADLQSHPTVQAAGRRAHLLGSDYKRLVGQLGDGVRNFNIPEQYASAIYGARDTIASGLHNAIDSPQIRKAHDIANEVYQQGAWAYQYWQVEENAGRHAENIVNLTKTILMKKFEELADKFAFLKNTRVSVYDPEHGEIQVEVALPIPLQSLDAMPDLAQYHQQASNAIDSYVPDKDTVMHYYNQYSPWASNESAPADDMMSQFKAYQPSQRGQRRRQDRVRGI